jgi:hypothetical protein
VRSRDGALALSVAADRSGDGQDDLPDEYLRRTATHLAGYRALRVEAVRRLARLRYPAAALTASGVFTRTGVRQQILIYALRRPGQVTYSVAAFRSAGVPASRYAALLDAIVRSFRARPPEF